MSKARYWAITSKGRTDDVLRLLKTSRGFHTLRIRHTGDGHFAVWAMNALGRHEDLLANTVGAYKGTVQLPAGTRYVSVTASGPWSIVRK